MKAPASMIRQFVPRKALSRLSFYAVVFGISFIAVITLSRYFSLTPHLTDYVDKLRSRQRLAVSACTLMHVILYMT